MQYEWVTIPAFIHLPGIILSNRRDIDSGFRYAEAEYFWFCNCSPRDVSVPRPSFKILKATFGYGRLLYQDYILNNDILRGVPGFATGCPFKLGAVD